LLLNLARGGLGVLGVCGRRRYAVRGKEVQDLGFGEVEAEGFEGDFEFVVVYSLVLIKIKQSKSFVDLFFLFVAELV